MRSAYEPIPWLSTAAAPKVSAVTGLGTGGGAGVQTSDGSGFGKVNLRGGVDAPASGSVTLIYGAIPPTMFYACDFGDLSVSGQGTATHILSWTAADWKKSGRGCINYEWAVSQ